MVLVSSAGVPAGKDVVSILDSLSDVIPFFKWSSAFVFYVAYDGDTKGLYFS